jgi:hypothetical protein
MSTRKLILLSLIVTSFAISPSNAQENPMCSGYEEASKWPPELDAVKAAPKNHRVLLENDELRVLEVIVQPGEREELHHHRWPSVMIVDARPNYVNYDKDGNEIKPAVPPPATPVYPIVARLPPQAAHKIQVFGGQPQPFHATRIEFKKLCGSQ